MLLLSKKGQLGETMTWAVATIVILVFSVLFLFAVNALSISKGSFLGGTLFASGGAVETNQQTLFAILTKQPDLSSGNAASGIGAILSDLEAKGMSCNFESSGIMINKGSRSGAVIMNYQGKGVRLEC